MNLVKKLHQTAKENHESQLREAEQVLDSVKANLKVEDEKDSEMLKYFGTKKVIVEHTQIAVSIKKKIDGEFITREDVKKICIQYGLRCLNSNYYKKEIPTSALNDLRRFKEENNIGEYSMNNNLFVIAPKDHFSLGKRPQNDPVLLYNDNGIYRVISKWGSDFGFTRRIRGVFMESPMLASLVITFFLLNLILLAIYINTSAWEIWLSNLGVLFLWGAIVAEMDFLSTSELWDKPHE